jgi:hypothetical protein
MRFLFKGFLILMLSISFCGKPDNETSRKSVSYPSPGNYSLITFSYKMPGEFNETFNSISSMALFISIADVDIETLLKAMNLPYYLWSVSFTKDTCLVNRKSLSPTLSTLPETATVDFLDAGDIYVKYLGFMDRLDIKSFPELNPSLFGVTYEKIIDRGYPFGHDHSVSIAGYGNIDVGHFELKTEFPQPFKLQSSKEQAKNDSIRNDRKLTVQWTNPDSKSDLFVLELLIIEPSDMIEMICSVRDDGEYTFPEYKISEVLTNQEITGMKLTGRRMKINTFAADGIEDGMIISEVVDSKNIYP